MKSILRLRRGATLAALLACAAFSACVVVHDNTTTASGTKVAPDAFAQIGPGKSQAFVAGLLGEPSTKVKTDGGGERWKWRYVETKKTTSGFIFVFMNKEETKVEQTYCVEFADGVVTRTWKE